MLLIPENILNIPIDFISIAFPMEMCKGNTTLGGFGGPENGPASPGWVAAPTFLCLGKEKSPPQRWKRNCCGAKRHVVPFLLPYGGRCSRCPGNLIASCRVRCTLKKQRECFPAFGGLGAAFGVVNDASSFSFRCRCRSGGEVQNRGPAGPLVWSFQGGPGETGEAPPAADEASLFRGSGAIGGPKGAGNRIAATVLKSKRPHVSGGGRRGRGLCAKDLSPPFPAPCQDALCMIRSSARFSPSPTRANTAAGQPRARRPTALWRPLLAKEPSAMPMLADTDSVEAQRLTA